jgi:hypothetical protein
MDTVACCCCEDQCLCLFQSCGFCRLCWVQWTGLGCELLNILFADELMILTMDFVFRWTWSLVVVTGKLAVAWAFCTMLLAFCEHYVDDRFGAWFGVQLVVIELLFLWLSSFTAEAHSCKSLLVVGLCEFSATSWCWIILLSWIYKTLVWSLLLKRERDGFGDYTLAPIGISLSKCFQVI